MLEWVRNDENHLPSNRRNSVSLPALVEPASELTVGEVATRDVLTAGGYAVDVAGTRHSVRLSARSPHDPATSHLHC